MTMSPAFLPDGSALRQVTRIAFISPWAFIGFESVSHSAAEYHFRHSLMFRIMVAAVAVTTALYVFVILLSVSAYPETCSGWLDYISRLNEASENVIMNEISDYIDDVTVDAAIEEATAEDSAVAVCDVNGLKVINDTLGHKAGDEYIISASRMICDIFRHSPVYRTGGDEFVAVLSGRDYYVRQELIAELHDRSAAHIRSREVVISGGLSDFAPGRDVCFHDVFERADALMYEEKKLLKSMGAISREDAETHA